MAEPTISSIRCRTLRISERTEWTFVEVACSDGIVGLGEASVNGAGAVLRAHAALIAPRLEGRLACPNVVQALAGAGKGGLPERAVVSAIEQALWDAQGRRLGVSVATLLGGAVREAVPVYANINRRTRERSPEGFADSAREAVEAGFDAVKLAPFDGVAEGQSLGDDVRLAAGLECVAGVCEAVGSAARVLVDCHWRLDEAAATRVLDFAADHGLFWVECPVPESPAHLPLLLRVRAHASRRGVRLAGMEKGLTLADFRPHVEEGTYNVLMPDVKYDGGFAATRSIAALAATAGVGVAPHNPTGPVCHAASMAVSATLANLLILEVQFRESSYFHELTGKPLSVRAGALEVSREPGLGIALDPDLMDELEVA